MLKAMCQDGYCYNERKANVLVGSDVESRKSVLMASLFILGAAFFVANVAYVTSLGI